MDKFKVGQKVRYKGLVLSPELNGSVVEIIEPQRMRRGMDSKTYFGYLVTDPDVDGRIGLEKNLEPVYDGDQPASWETSVWKPKELSTKEY